MTKIRLRFAPSPTGALHIGGVRTALYNYLFAKKNGGTFILRIEDTDQTRYVDWAEEYIQNALDWFGIELDEGPSQGGEYGPYRQSERSALYQKYAAELVKRGNAYYAFDTAEELDVWREQEKEAGVHTPRYDYKSRMKLKNSLTLPAEEVDQLLEANTAHTIRLKIDPGQQIVFTDLVRGEVKFESDNLDDKVILKGDGLPTYHLANIVDDHLMEISHVIRGEEWLSSTAHHVLMYQYLEWDKTMPAFAHLPLILKPTGKGKLSKRDGNKLGIPVFPLTWNNDEGESFLGFKEYGFDPAAAINFLALLGWNPGTEQEVFTLDQLIESFSIENIGKSGARFDIEKAKWFNQQFIQQLPDDTLGQKIVSLFGEHGQDLSLTEATQYASLLKERAQLYPDFFTQGKFIAGEIEDVDFKVMKKKWKAENGIHFEKITESLSQLEDWNSSSLSDLIKTYITDNELSFGAIFPVLRVAISGKGQGPDLFGILELLGKEKALNRLNKIPVLAEQALNM